MMKTLVNELICPADGNKLSVLPDNGMHNGVIRAGVLQCVSCNSAYPIWHGIPDLTVLSGDGAIVNDKKHEIEVRDQEAVKIYDEIVGSYRTRLEWRALRKRLGNLSGKKVVDVGCGTGRITVNLVRAGASVVGVDYSKKSLLETLEKVGGEGRGLEVIAADITVLPLPDNHFDLAVCSQVIEHLLSPEQRLLMIKNIARTLKPGGVLALTAYNYNNEMKKLLGSSRQGFSSSGVIFYCYTAAELAQHLGQFLRVDAIACIEHKLPFGLPKRLGRPFGFWLDDLITCLPVAFATGHLLLAVASKES